MNEKEFKIWLQKTVNDAFMNMFYYDLKEDDEMSLSDFKELERIV